MRAFDQCRYGAAIVVACGSFLCCCRSVQAQSSDLRAKYAALRDAATAEPSGDDNVPREIPTFIASQSEQYALFERYVHRAMERTITAGFTDATLSEVAKTMSRELRLPIFLDEKHLAEASISLDTKVTFARQTAPGRTILKAILDPMDLNWVVAGGAITLTTDSVEKERVFTRIYPVRDLVAGVDESGNEDYDFDSLIDLIQSGIAPTSWGDSGGTGGISPFAQSVVLVISQTREVHEQIEDLLTALRTARRVQHLPEIPRFQTWRVGRSDEADYRSELRAPQTVRRSGSTSSVPAWRVPRDSEGRPMATLGPLQQAGGGAF